MPELPEVETVRRVLAGEVLGREVRTVAASRVRLRAGIDPGAWKAMVPGGTFAGVERYGKYLLLRLDTADLVFHLGMSGRLAIVDSACPAAAHTHLVLGLDDGRDLRFVDPRRFGSAVVLVAGSGPAYPGIVTLGVDPIAGELAGVLLTQGRRTRRGIRALLLDQRVVAGVGNIYANEALALAGIRPDRPAASIGGGRLRRLAAAVRGVLTDAIAAGGTTLEDGGFADPSGGAGTFAVRLRVYGRAGEACERCGAAIVRRLLAGRAAYYCPRCQR